MAVIMTASWSVHLPAGATAVGISRGVPRNRSGFRRLRELEPGPWFRSVCPETYLRRYREILERLDPAAVRDRLMELGRIPVLLCFERAHDIQSGAKWCHRHVVAQWLEDRLSIKVEEVGFPELDRFAFLRTNGIAPPSYLR